MSGGPDCWTDWLNQAVSFVRFPPDREEVQRELRDHLEDKAADLRRIFPDMDDGEAERAALNMMGDPEDIGKELARIHRPWPGYIWLVSKWLLGLAFVAFMAEMLLGLGLVWDLVWPDMSEALVELLSQ